MKSKHLVTLIVGFTIMIALLLTFLSCDIPDDSDTSPQTDPQDPLPEPPISYIYFGGRESDGTIGIAKIWKVNKDDYSDVTETSFTDGSSYMTVMDMKLVNGVMYSLIYNGSSHKLNYYKDHELIKEFDDEYVYGKSIEVIEEMVYVFGGGNDNFYIWTVNNVNNEVSRYTIASGQYPSANAMLLSGDDIYLCGCEFDEFNTIYISYIWKGSISNPNNGFPSTAYIDSVINSLYIDNETLYACGSQFSTENLNYLATYWEIDMSDMSITDTVSLAENTNYYSTLQGIKVAGTDIHIIGYESTVNGTSFYQLKYWLNGTTTNLNIGDDFCSVNNFTIDDDTVYIVGYERILDTSVPFSRYNDVARFWDNGVSHDLTDATDHATLQCIQVE